MQYILIKGMSVPAKDCFRGFGIGEYVRYNVSVNLALWFLGS